MPLAVLVVEPNRQMREAMTSALSDGDFAVTHVASFEEAAALSKTGQFAILVTAERLGAHNGLHLVLRARADNPSVIAVVTSAAPDPALAADAATFAAAHMVAPWSDPRALVSTLRSLLPVQL